MKPGDKVKTSLGPGSIVSQGNDKRFLVNIDSMIKSTYFRAMQQQDGGIYFSEQTLNRMNPSAKVSEKQIGLHF